MPLYRYRCQNCGHEFEKLHKLTDNENVTLDDFVKCPICYDIPERLIGKPAVHYHGSNFTKGVSDDG